jgi:molybdate transport system substrate-binding protein
MRSTAKFRRIIFAAVLCAAQAAGGSGARAAQKPCGTITVAAASDLAAAMKEIAANYEKSTKCQVRVSTGSSGNFLTQIENGAPFDVFFSADVSYPKKLESEGLAAPGSTVLYAVGKIVLWVRRDSLLDITKGIAILRDQKVRKIAIANPLHAPYGRAAEEALRGAGIYDAVKDRLVLGENISQAAQFAESGNADAGIVALSLAQSAPLKDEGRYAPIPDQLYTPIQQGAVVLRAAPNPQRAQAFLDYVRTPDIIGLLSRYGFTLPAKGSQ